MHLHTHPIRRRLAPDPTATTWAAHRRHLGRSPRHRQRRSHRRRLGRSHRRRLGRPTAAAWAAAATAAAWATPVSASRSSARRCSCRACVIGGLSPVASLIIVTSASRRCRGRITGSVDSCIPRIVA